MNPRKIFSVRSRKQFESLALEIFGLQAKQNPVYKTYIQKLGLNPENVTRVEQIPFLPIEFFKSLKVISNQLSVGNRSPMANGQAVFLSSGTTRQERSKHYVSDVKLYQQSFHKCFELFYGNVKKYSILAFLPSYYENKNSSLLYMVNDLMHKSGKRESRFYKNKEQKILFSTLYKLLAEKRNVILFGVSYALLDLTAEAALAARSRIRKGRGKVIVLETGGMKGRREEITREALHKTLCEKFGVKKIHSEYGMTELLSQAYSKGDGIFNAPPWMKVLIRDPNDPFSFLPAGRSGAINIIDLANINSCSFIATQDIGRAGKKRTFEVLGRMDNSDLRGCNLLAQ